jgi:hypothetical protein
VRGDSIRINENHVSHVADDHPGVPGRSVLARFGVGEII